MARNMDATMLKIQQKLDQILKFLNPLLPMANCHMVEFFTDHHWDTFVPEPIAKEIKNIEMDKVLEKFWKVASHSQLNDSSSCDEISKFVCDAHSSCIAVDGETCLSVPQFENKIKEWGGTLKPEIRVKEFMNSKKSYEVQTMSRLVASLTTSAGGSLCVDAGAGGHGQLPAVCVDAGGGRGQLPAVLALGYGLRALTLDCDPVALESGRKRERLIQKQWHAIAEKAGGDTPATFDKKDGCELHKFVNLFVTNNTNLIDLVRESFPDQNEDITILLTGLHTCGDLGAASARLLARGAARALLTVPCCYHLLSEATGDTLWSAFDNSTAERSEDKGFPMSDYMQGYQLGRNARMLASQSIERAASRRAPPPRSLLYRAVLQVIIKDHLQNKKIAEGKLKRLSSKSQTLPEYVRAADNILKLDIDKLSASTLDDIFKVYSSQWDKLVLFYLLRLCLAQVIESVILLDRLLYLKECGVKESFLVRLFDPVLSPRCHAILALC